MAPRYRKPFKPSCQPKWQILALTRYSKNPEDFSFPIMNYFVLFCLLLFYWKSLTNVYALKYIYILITLNWLLKFHLLIWVQTITVYNRLEYEQKEDEFMTELNQSRRYYHSTQINWLPNSFVCSFAIIYLYLIPIWHIPLSGHSLSQEKSENCLPSLSHHQNFHTQHFQVLSFRSYWNCLTLQGLAQSSEYSEIHIVFTAS